MAKRAAVIDPATNTVINVILLNDDEDTAMLGDMPVVVTETGRIGDAYDGKKFTSPAQETPANSKLRDLQAKWVEGMNQLAETEKTEQAEAEQARLAAADEAAEVEA